eukprot:CAMPEP_0198198830 /NCGR_PEP_ID=MMETSP1445-20131203/2198_1 /TAXON_ID=36898 /ORGANISM="Pyramimonas sp., Strain CCMP2087" /LENGTH=127 /DNA_ID=CAMNT_0043868475 /DNA_START=78 /DNA_END=457 /DNA_ORIENTATION=-
MSIRALSRAISRPMQANAEGTLLKSCRRIATLHAPYQMHQPLGHPRYGLLEAKLLRKNRSSRLGVAMSYGSASRDQSGWGASDDESRDDTRTRERYPAAAEGWKRTDNSRAVDKGYENSSWDDVDAG